MSYIVIGYYQFALEDPYSEGYILSESEARILSWYRARLIQRALTKPIQDAIDASPNEILSPEEVEELSHTVDAFNASYELEFKKEPKCSILEYHLQQIAENILYRSGQTDLKQEDVDRVKKVPEVQARARDRVKSGTFSFEELFS
jgi:hypothetical protein